MKKLIPAALLTLLAPLLVLATLLLQYGTGTAEGPVELGADTNTSGNSETSVGTVDGCVSVNTGDTFDLDIVVSNVDQLVHWELYLRFDPSIIEVVARDMHMFLDINSYSSVKTEWASYSDGREFLGAADLRGAPESGSGVLARLTLEALGPGLSHADIFYFDFDHDGDDDFGPRLTAEGGIPVGDVTGDGVFDGPTHHALIAVDESCQAATPPPTLPPSPTPQPGGGSAPSETSPPPDVLPVPGDPTFEPPSDSSPPADDGSAAANDQDSAADGEPEGASGEGTGDEEAEGPASDGSGEGDAGDDSEDAAVLADEGAPGPADAGDDSGLAPAGGSSPSSSSGGDLPLWAIGAIAAAVLVAAAGTSVFLAARTGGRYGR